MIMPSQSKIPPNPIEHVNLFPPLPDPAQEMPCCFSRTSQVRVKQISSSKNHDVRNNPSRPQLVVRAQAETPLSDSVYLPSPNERREIKRKINYAPPVSSDKISTIQISESANLTSPSPVDINKLDSPIAVDLRLTKSPKFTETEKEVRQNIILTGPEIHNLENNI